MDTIIKYLQEQEATKGVIIIESNNIKIKPKQSLDREFFQGLTVILTDEQDFSIGTPSEHEDNAGDELILSIKYK